MRLRPLPRLAVAATLVIAATAACGPTPRPHAAPGTATPASAAPSSATAASVTLESADDWNYPNRNYFRCVVLKGDSTRLLYPDGRPVGPPGAYEVRMSASRYQGAPGGASLHDRMACPPGELRLDAHEALESARGLLHFHKGGQGYADSRVPYGHILAADIVGGEAVVTQRPRSRPPEWGAPSATRNRGWDDQRRNGRGCEPMAGGAYRIALVPQGSPDALPTDWQYKPEQTGSRYAKYADAGPEQGAGTAHYAYLVWSWMLRGDGVTTSGGGGMVRAILRDGQPFLRCAVQPIDGVAWAPGSTTEVGRVTAVYGKTRASADGPWVYGWAIWAHRPKLASGGYGPEILHMQR